MGNTTAMARMSAGSRDERERPLSVNALRFSARSERLRVNAGRCRAVSFGFPPVRPRGKDLASAARLGHCMSTDSPGLGGNETSARFVKLQTGCEAALRSSAIAIALCGEDATHHGGPDKSAIRGVVKGEARPT